MKSIKLISIGGGAIVIIVVGFVVLNFRYEVPKPKEWPANVRVYRTSITGQTSVYDGSSGKYLFSYKPEYDPNVRPIKIEQLDANHWQVIFENPTTK